MLAANSLMGFGGNAYGMGGGETGTTPERNTFNMMTNYERYPMMNRTANLSLESRNPELFSPYMQRPRTNIQVPTPLRHNVGGNVL